MAEKYLIKEVSLEGCPSGTFDELRHWSFRARVLNFADLPPTSESMNFHILRAFYVTYRQINSLENSRSSLNHFFHFIFFQVEERMNLDLKTVFAYQNFVSSLKQTANLVDACDFMNFPGSVIDKFLNTNTQKVRSYI